MARKTAERGPEQHVVCVHRGGAASEECVVDREGEKEQRAVALIGNGQLDAVKQAAIEEIVLGRAKAIRERRLEVRALNDVREVVPYKVVAQRARVHQRVDEQQQDPAGARRPRPPSRLRCLVRSRELSHATG